jgi:putative nucleotidyltransferase with HDIG domain
MATHAAAALPIPLPREETRRLVQRIVDLPTLPVIVPEVLRLVADPHASAVDLARVIGTDQALASRILRLANSAFYGFRREIVTINHAIVLLGFETVKNLVLASTVFDILGEGAGGPSFDREQFWLHAAATAVAARQVARTLRATDPEAIFVSGLLHDIGKVVLDRFFGRRYAEAARLAAEQPCLIRDAEVAVFSIHHGEVGRWLGERWRFPAAIVEPIAFHHRPTAASPDQRAVTAIVHLADILTRNAGIGSGGDALVPLPDPEILQRFRLGGGHMARWTEGLLAERDTISEFLQVIH